DVDVAIAVPVDRVGPRHHLHRPGLDDLDAIRGGRKRRLDAGRTAARVDVDAAVVFELAGDEVFLAVAVPVDEIAEIWTRVGDDAARAGPGGDPLGGGEHRDRVGSDILVEEKTAVL